MNILIDELPTSIDVDGKSYLIETNFRICLKVILAFEDPNLTAQEKNFVLISNMLIDVPHNINLAVKQIVRFLDGPVETDNNSESDVPQKRHYSFSKDANFIFSAFKQTHHIDLDTVDMHWWKFVALFMDIGSDTVFASLVNLRKRVGEGKASKEERKMARELGDVFRLDEIDTRTPEQLEAEARFMAALAGE